jgi:hypothetical protein
MDRSGMAPKVGTSFWKRSFFANIWSALVT